MVDYDTTPGGWGADCFRVDTGRTRPQARTRCPAARIGLSPPPTGVIVSGRTGIPGGQAMRQAEYARIEKAIQYLGDHFRRQPDLRDVAREVGLSEYHFHRMFTRWAGIGPKRFLQILTAEHARSLLRETPNVLDAAYGAGLSGPGRLHDLLVNVYAMTPGEMKGEGAGLTIRYGIHPSPFGDCLVAITDRGICGLSFLPGKRSRTWGDSGAGRCSRRTRWQRKPLRTGSSTLPVARLHPL